MKKSPTKRNEAAPVAGRSKLPSRGEGDILDRMRRIVPDLNEAEARTARCILAEPNWVTQSSIKALAQKAEVSEPTVIRLCRRLDMEGFKALKHRLTEDLVLSNMYLEAPAVVGNSSSEQLAAALLDTSMRALRAAAEKIDHKRIESGVEAIFAARMVYCIGVGGSSAILAEETENRLFRLGVAAQAIQDPYRQRMTAAIAGKGDLFIAISSTGIPASVVESMELARRNGATTLSLTQAGSALAEVSDIVLEVDIFNDETFFMLPSRTRYAQMFVLDFLVGALASRVPEAADKLKSIRDTLKALHGVIRYQPIGD
ncbi:MAG: MurR/RpiR family transcriptional regulator [Rhizobiaceae bacterium]|nr:MurR/RpiR family transcriptional regulator [Rhizobiaceae bacterium]